MDSKKLLPGNVTIKTEPNVTSPKKVLLTTSPFAQLAAKNLSNSRLASFKPPRDLFLTGSNPGHTNSSLNINSSKSSRKTFMPNINVTRKKGANEALLNDSSNEGNQKSRDNNKNRRHPPPPKKRNTNMVQTKGVFSEGLAPGKVKAFGSSSTERSHCEKPALEKPKLNLNKKIFKSEEDTKLKSIFKDDFVDDPSLVPDISFVPNCLPMVYNVKKQEHASNLEKTFETLQVKSEKVSNVHVKEIKNDKNVEISIFDNKSPKLLLFEFPAFIQGKDEGTEKKKNFKSQKMESEKQINSSEGLSSLGEGFLGHLRIHENGKTYFVTGKTIIPLCVTRHSTRQEIMSTSLDQDSSKGEVISLGTVDASFTCSANFFQDLS